MKKSLAMFTALVLCLSAFTGCSGNTSTSSAADAASTAGTESTAGAESTGEAAPEELSGSFTYWTFTDFSNNLVEAFEKENPGVSIDIQVFGGDEYKTKLLTTLQSGQDIPDMFDLEASYVYEFLDSEEKPVGICAKDLKNVVQIRRERVRPELTECSFRVACDVTNPLCGPNGATYIYGPQKGVSDDMREGLDRDLKHFADVTEKYTGTDCGSQAGAGAAGGLGYAFMAYLKADLCPGIDLVMEAVEMDKAMRDADLVFTGEGRLDHQTAMGKAPAGVARLAKKYGAKVIALAGSVADGAEACNEAGIDAYFPILRQVVSLDEAMELETARKNMIKTAEQIMRLIKALQK